MRSRRHLLYIKYYSVVVNFKANMQTALICVQQTKQKKLLGDSEWHETVLNAGQSLFKTTIIIINVLVPKRTHLAKHAWE